MYFYEHVHTKNCPITKEEFFRVGPIFTNNTYIKSYIELWGKILNVFNSQIHG